MNSLPDRFLMVVGGNVALGKLLVIGEKIAIEIGWHHEPTDEERAVFDASVHQIFCEYFGEDSVTSSGSQVIMDPEKRRAAIRKYLGGGQG